MTFFVQLLLIHASTVFALQYNLIDDDASNGIISLPLRNCNIFEKEKSITYAINLAILNELEKMNKELKNDCYNEVRLLETFHKRFHELNTIRSKNSIGNSTHDILITSSLEGIHLIEDDLKLFYIKNGAGYCLTFRNKLNHFNNIFMEIDKLSRSDFSTLGKQFHLQD